MLIERNFNTCSINPGKRSGLCNRYFNQVYSFGRVMYSTKGTKYEAIGFELVTDECIEGTIKLKERKTPDMRYSMQKLKIIWSK